MRQEIKSQELTRRGGRKPRTDGATDLEKFKSIEWLFPNGREGASRTPIEVAVTRPNGLAAVQDLPRLPRGTPESGSARASHSADSQALSKKLPGGTFDY